MNLFVRMGEVPSENVGYWLLPSKFLSFFKAPKGAVLAHIGLFIGGIAWIPSAPATRRRPPPVEAKAWTC